MTKTGSQLTLEEWGAVLPALIAGAVLALAPWWQPRLGEGVSGEAWPLPLLVVVAAVSGWHGPWGRRTLGLGTVVLAPAIVGFGAAAAGWVALLGMIGSRGLARTLLPDVGRRVRGGEEAGSWRTGLGDAGRVALAATLAGILWTSVAAGREPVGTSSNWMVGVGAGFAYLVVCFGLRVVEGWPGTFRQVRLGSTRDVARLALSLSLDLAGWLAGILVAGVMAVMGWGWAAPLLVVFALIVAEAERNAALRRRSVQRLAGMWEMTRAGHRIIFQESELAGIVGRVLDECRNVLPVAWFHFELLDETEKVRSWAGDNRGRVEAGVPVPDDRPPVLPGIHRRVEWRVLDRRLAAGGSELARLKIWCDPRQVDGTAIELFDSLLPQFAAAVQRALLQRQAHRDALTGLADRSLLEVRLEEGLMRAVAKGRPLAVVMSDLDGFKQVNDRYGHDAGDRALVKVSEVLRGHLRATDLCCRWGGEEFVVLLEKADGAAALRVAERLRAAVSKAGFEHEGRQYPLTLSVGAAAFPDLHVKEPKELLKLADEALYEAKSRGRNRAFLNLGLGRFKSAEGDVVETETTRPDIEPPTLFA